MTPKQTPTAEHLQFDALCETLDEFEPLPSVVPAAESSEEEPEQAAPIDALILAALVSP
jgi:hypothetical protein